ncbi:MAG: site-2 protease family protein, partial [Terriglobales bacterium]
MAQAGKKSNKGTIFGGIGVLGVLALKFKGLGLAALKAASLFKLSWLLPSAISMILSIGVFTAMYGWSYGVAVVLLIFIHEMGHWIWMKASGFEPKAPMFIPGIGAYVAMTKLPPNETERAWVAFAGPLIGGIGSAVLYWAGMHTGNEWMMAAGNTGFFLNLLQLLPARPLDGGFVV